MIAAIAAFVLGFSLVSKRIQATIISPPMVFVVFGLVMGPSVLGLIELSPGSPIFNLVAELTLIVVIFTDASRIDLRLLLREHDIPLRLLTIGLPLTIAAGAMAAAAMFDFANIWEAAVLAVVLAPTDAALGQAVVASPRVPPRIRQALNVESGLNDGIALPILLFFISVASAVHQADYAYWLEFTTTQIILGPVAGVAVGYFGGRLVSWAERYDWVAEAFQRLVVLGIALLAFALAELIGGNGFIAAFVAGLVLGNRFPKACRRVNAFAEAEGQLLTLLTFMIYGAVMVVPALMQVSWPMVGYTVLSLTLIRMVPVAISQIGMHLQWRTVLFLGWFGPRGVSSILYGLMVLKEGVLQDELQIFAAMVVTVFFSVFAHGITALPATNAYGARAAEAMKHQPGLPELEPVTEMPVRVPMAWGSHPEA